MFLPDAGFFELHFSFFLIGFIPALIMAGSAIAGQIAKRKGQGQAQMNQYNAEYNKRVWEEKNFDPYGPLRRGAKGALWGAQMKTWGFDKLFPKDMLDFVADPRNVPGTKGMLKGGKAYGQPGDTGMPQPKTGMGFWDYLSTGLGGAQAFGQAMPTGGGGGVPSGIPEEAVPPYRPGSGAAG